MSIKIAHAKMDEDGKIAGPIKGDQTGKEIQVASFYQNDSVYLLICRDAVMADRAATYGEQIARDDDYGYSQAPDKRWSGYRSIVANGGRVRGTGGSFDCATLVLTAYILAGLNIPPEGYTGDIRQRLEATGMFDIYQGAKYTDTDTYARRGCLYLRPKTSARGGHVFMALEDGAGELPTLPVESSSLATNDRPVIGRIVVDGVKRWCNVRSGAGTEHAIIGRANKDAEYDLLGSEDDWYMINYDGQIGYIHGNLASEIMEGNV